MAGAALVDIDPVGARLSRLARMPADTGAAIARLRIQIDAAREALGETCEPLLLQSFGDASPIAPCMPAAADVGAAVHDLETVLLHRHPEEIRVASFVFWCRVAARLRENHGARAVQALLAALEAASR